MSLPVLVISRPKDSSRRGAFLAAAEDAGVMAEVVAAVDGDGDGLSAHADLLGDAFWGGPTIKPGAFGCFLSHRLAWARVVEMGAPALVCEDDARLTDRPVYQPEHDLTFVNQRLTAWRSVVAQEGDPGALPVGDLMTRLNALGGPKALGLSRAPGADAYVLTPKGAGALLEVTGQDKCVAGVDWLMLWRGMNTSTLKHRDVRQMREMKRLLKDPGPGPQVVSAAIGPCLAGMAEGESVLRHSVTVHISSLKHQSLLPGAPGSD